MGWDPTALLLLAALADQLRAEGLDVRDVRVPQLSTLPPGTVAAAVAHKTLMPTSAFAARHELAGSGDLHTAARRAALRSMARSLTTARVDEALTGFGVRPLFVKGIALSLQTTGTPTARSPGDIDVLVGTEDIAPAVVALQRLGWQVRAGAQALVGNPLGSARLHAVTLDHADGTSIDLHHRLDHCPTAARVEFHELWRRRASLPFPGRTIATLSPVDAALFIAVNSGHDAWAQLGRVADLLRLFHVAEREGVEITGIERQAASWAAGTRFAVALAVARRLRPDLPRQSPGPEALAAGVWRRYASGRKTWPATTIAEKARVDLFRLVATGTPQYTAWWVWQAPARWSESLARRRRLSA